MIRSELRRHDQMRNIQSWFDRGGSPSALLNFLPSVCLGIRTIVGEEEIESDLPVVLLSRHCMLRDRVSRKTRVGGSIATRICAY